MRKVVVFLIAFLGLMIFVQSFSCTSEQYRNFLKDFQIQEPKSEDQFTRRFTIYCENLQKIHTKNAQNDTYTVKEYKWMDRSQSEIQKFLKLDVDIQQVYQAFKVDEDVKQSISSTYKSVGAPVSVDYRASGKVSSIKDQGSCGSCWTFATVGLYESWMMLQGERELDLSEEYILECTTPYAKYILDKSTVSDCSGGNLQHAANLIKQNGAPLQSTYPYLAYNYTTKSGTPTTPGICQTNLTYVYAADPTVTSFQAWQNNSHTSMKQLIAVSPLAAAMYAPQQLLSYSTGVFTGCGTTSFWGSYLSLNHAVVIVGYDASGNYIIKNSWGTKWGQNGYGVISKDRDCGLSSFAFKYFSRVGPGKPMEFSGQVKLKGEKRMWGGMAVLLVLLAALML